VQSIAWRYVTQKRQGLAPASFFFAPSSNLRKKQKSHIGSFLKKTTVYQNMHLLAIK
jgi:hypothetical protein